MDSSRISRITATSAVESSTLRESYQAECQRYLEKFRVAELKELLRRMGVSQRGRKTDLFFRANELIGNVRVQREIQKIYERERTHFVRKPMKILESYSMMKDLAHHQHDLHQTDTKSHSPKPMTSPFVLKDPGPFVIHPDVKFKAHPFYQIMECIVRPTALVTTRTNYHANSMMLQFHLTPQQVQAICSSRNTQGNYGIQVLLRFARKELSCEQEDFYPKKCHMKVNGNFCALGYKPHMSVRPRLCSPINITNFIKTSVTKTNDITFTWTSDILYYPQGFCVCIDLVKSLSSSDLLQKLKQKVVRNPEISRALVREKLAIDQDSEVSATALKVSIICPLGKLRMTHPCKSQTCTHLQCFDASIYLQMNERKSKWMCPVCDKLAPLETLIIDGLFKEICAESASTDIGFLSDGSWYSITAKNRISHSLSPEKRCLTVTITDGPRGGGTESDPIIIDLTSDSEEEDEQPTNSVNAVSVITESIPSPSYNIVTNTTQNHLKFEPRDEIRMDFFQSIKRRCSSSTDDHDACNLPLKVPAIASVSSTAALPMPVIKEYAPILPCFISQSSTCMKSFLPQPFTMQTVLASSDTNLLLSGSNVPSFSLDENLLALIQQNDRSSCQLKYFGLYQALNTTKKKLRILIRVFDISQRLECHNSIHLVED